MGNVWRAEDVRILNTFGILTNKMDSESSRLLFSFGFWNDWKAEDPKLTRILLNLSPSVIDNFDRSISRIGAIAASLHNATRSELENPLVFDATSYRISLDVNPSIILCLFNVFVISSLLASLSGKFSIILFGNRLKTASSNSYGRFVAPITRIRSSGDEVAPSNWMRNSVFIRRDTSASFSERSQRIESISSEK
ncbi:hypothetical protein GCK72_017158 [Caenorhabditis remanei]|uniref:Uncharacterized protein n=1 Tax=Caenorhabditis remanei TaxID=31234 RepID=A0A6A5G6J8_CAERE|nr:hypothetical protein GCK72_017158 [Caenorhabditis remanei]KAF1750607.1 hypothetical protein GCK72_017158 [Caenorhabditis remanei]